MTRNKTLLNNNEIGDLQVSKSVVSFHFLQTVTNRLFLCLFVNFYYYSTKNHNQQWLFHLKTVV